MDFVVSPAQSQRSRDTKIRRYLSFFDLESFFLYFSCESSDGETETLVPKKEGRRRCNCSSSSSSSSFSSSSFPLPYLMFLLSPSPLSFRNVSSPSLHRCGQNLLREVGAEMSDLMTCAHTHNEIPRDFNLNIKKLPFFSFTEIFIAQIDSRILNDDHCFILSPLLWLHVFKNNIFSLVYFLKLMQKVKK